MNYLLKMKTEVFGFKLYVLRTIHNQNRERKTIKTKQISLLHEFANHFSL